MIKMEGWAKRKVPGLRAECKRKELPHAGRKHVLVKRLEFANDEALHTPQGRKAHYEQECQKRLGSIIPFTFFPKFPPEIRDQIWKYSLPGPRVLRTDTQRIDPDKLHFPTEYRTPNPSALYVCQESRAVALTRYRLCFGTQDIYANLPGGDIIFMQPEMLAWKWTLRTDRPGPSGKIIRGEEIPQGLSDAVKSDLARIKHIVLPCESWTQHSQRYQGTWDGLVLRQSIARLKSVERVSLITKPKEGMDGPYVGYINLIDPYWEQPQEEMDLKPEDVSRANDLWPDDEEYKHWVCLRRRYLKLHPEFDLGLTFEEEELAKVPPKTKIVEMEFVPYDGPPRLREKDW
jgi:hypothetical protein